MPTTLNPYLNFPGTARESMEFYERVLGGTLTLMTFADAGAQDVPDPSQVMHALDGGHRSSAAVGLSPAT